MNQNMNSAPTLPPANPKSNTTLIIIIVLVVLCCLCALVAGALWQFGDALLEMFSGIAG